MEGDHCGARPVREEGEQVNPGVPKIDMQEIWLMAIKNLLEATELTAVDDRRLLADIFEVEAPEEIGTGGAGDLDWLKGEGSGL